MTAPEALPPLYAGWMRQALGARVPNESKATCHDCAMCRPGMEALPAVKTFDSGAKCCTYLPTLWNFLVGRILDDQSPEAAPGRASVERRIDAGAAVTPLGLEHTEVFALLYQHVAGSFGRARSLLCPHFLAETGGCGVWRHRESTCATWFCKHERGELGKHFWASLHALLKCAEVAVARWCAVELDPGADALELLFPPRERAKPPLSTPESFDGRVDVALQRRRWGRWYGREREFYREAERLAAPLGWAEIEGLGGIELSARLARVRAALSRLQSNEIPDGLRTGPVKYESLGGGVSLVEAYIDTDPLVLPDQLIGVLQYFDGRPNVEVLEEIGEKAGLELTPELVRRLADFGVLRTSTAT